MDETPIRAVEMVRSIRDRMHEETKGMSFEEWSAYIRERAARVEAQSRKRIRSPQADRTSKPAG